MHPAPLNAAAARRVHRAAFGDDRDVATESGSARSGALTTRRQGASHAARHGRTHQPTPTNRRRPRAGADGLSPNKVPAGGRCQCLRVPFRGRRASGGGLRRPVAQKRCCPPDPRRAPAPSLPPPDLLSPFLPRLACARVSLMVRAAVQRGPFEEGAAREPRADVDVGARQLRRGQRAGLGYFPRVDRAVRAGAGATDPGALLHAGR